MDGKGDRELNNLDVVVLCLMRISSTIRMKIGVSEMKLICFEVS